MTKPIWTAKDSKDVVSLFLYGEPCDCPSCKLVAKMHRALRAALREVRRCHIIGADYECYTGKHCRFCMILDPKTKGEKR
jgi:hypothetical protein